MRSDRNASQIDNPNNPEIIHDSSPWLDKPDRAGLWLQALWNDREWYYFVCSLTQKVVETVVIKAHIKWLRIEPPPEPPKE